MTIAKTYAQKVTRALSLGTSEKKLVDELVVHLTDTGRMKLLPLILLELKKQRAHEKRLVPLVEVAKESQATEALKEARALGIDAPIAHVNHTLIQGWRIRTYDTLVDRSAKHSLVELYRKITN